jgi:hypothetical protein
MTKEFGKSMGAFINALIRWSVRPSHRLKRFEQVVNAAEGAAPESDGK